MLQKTLRLRFCITCYERLGIRRSTKDYFFLSSSSSTPVPSSPPPSPLLQAALTSLQLKLVATVISEVLASPLPTLGMLKHRGSFSGVPAPGRATSGSGGWRGRGLGLSSTPTVTHAWALKRHEDWETLEVETFLYTKS